MSMFWIAAAGLVGLAWAMLWPAARAGGRHVSGAGQGSVGVLKEQIAALDADLAEGGMDLEQHRRARAEIAQRVLEEDRPAAVPAAAPGASRRSRIALGLAVPLLAFGLYAMLGNRDGLVAAPAQASAAEDPAQDISAMVARLQQRLERDPALPDALQGWTMLARAYAALQRFAEARSAFDRAIALAPDDAQLLADQAEVIASAQGDRTAGEPERLIAKALQLDPLNLKALALAGSAAFEHEDFKSAIALWGKARQLVRPGGKFAAGLDRGLAEARSAAGLPAPSAPAAAAGPATALVGRVSVAPALAARVAAGDTVFVFARAADGPRVPLAVLRRPASELPLAFKLDDSMAMSPGTSLAQAGKVVVVARISRSGSALPAAGDLQGQSTVIAPGTAGIELTIDSVQP